jgi:hypothetical protein
MLKNSVDVAETLRHSFCFRLFLLTHLPFGFFFLQVFFRFSSHLFSGQLLSACLNLFQLVSTQLISAFISSSQLFSALRSSQVFLAPLSSAQLFSALLSSSQLFSARLSFSQLISALSACISSLSSSDINSHLGAAM